MTTYGYIRTSRQRIQGASGSDPASQARQLHQEGVPEANIHRDVGISGGTGTNSRAGWRALDAKLAGGDTLVVVAIGRIGRRWMDTVNAVRDLRARAVRRTPGFRARRSRLMGGRRGGMPHKDRAIASGSLAERAAQSGRREYAEEEDIAVVAKPVLWKGRVAKVVAVAVPWELRRALEPQLGRLN